MRAGRRQRQRTLRAPQPQCADQPRSTFWLMNSCSDGFMTVVKNRPLVQAKGLDQHHPDAEFLKESCFMRDERLQGESVGPFVRYQHKKSKKYICFNKQGKVRTMNSPKAQRKGRLCMFLEEPLGPGYLRLRSAHNSEWYLGFNPKRSIHVHGGEFRASLPRVGGKGFGPRRCDFKFTHGYYTPPSVPTGVSDLLDNFTKNITKNTVNTKAALEDNEILDHSLNSEKEPSISQNNDLNTIETDPVIVISKKSDKPVVSAPNKKISSSMYHEKLKMQQLFLQAKKHKKIRHFKHKRPRVRLQKERQRQRQPRLQVKNQRPKKNSSSSNGQKMMKRRGQSVPRVPRPTRRRPRV